MLYATSKTWDGAASMIEEARQGGLYVAKANARLMVPNHDTVACGCNGTHWHIHRERRTERLSARSIASEAIDVAARLPGQVKPYRPRKQSHGRSSSAPAVGNPFKAIVAAYGPRRMDNELSASKTRAALAMRELRRSEGR